MPRTAASIRPTPASWRAPSSRLGATISTASRIPTSRRTPRARGACSSTPRATCATRSHLNIEIDPHRHVVGGALPGAHVLVDTGGEEAVGRLGRHQHVVDADAVVLLPGARLIVPERV